MFDAAPSPPLVERRRRPRNERTQLIWTIMTQLFAAAPRLAVLTLDDREITVFGGLRYIEGAAQPIFSMSYAIRREDGSYSAGALRSDDIDLFPEFEDLHRLLGCGLDGAPPNAAAFGWGLLGLFDPRPFNAVAFGELMRITPAEAEMVRTEIMTNLNQVVTIDGQPLMVQAYDAFLEWVESQRPRWRSDAESAIEAHGLEVYGDPYSGAFAA